MLSNIFQVTKNNHTEALACKCVHVVVGVLYVIRARPMFKMNSSS